MSPTSPALVGGFFTTEPSEAHGRTWEWGAFQMCMFWSLSRVRFFAIPWTAAHQASLYFTISWSLLKFMSID